MIRLLVLAALLWLGLSEARAGCREIQAPSQLASGVYECDTQGEAYAKVMSMSPPPYYADCNMRILAPLHQPENRDYIYRIQYPGNTCGIGYNQINQPGRATYSGNGTCANQPSMQNVRYTGNSGACSGGCEYAPVLGDSSKPYQVVTINGQKITKAASMAPTGQACTVGEETPAPLAADQDKCVQDATLTQCVKPNGDLCAVGKSGKEYCWKPEEAGVKLDSATGNEAATKSPQGLPINAPRDTPKNGGDWQVTGQSQVTINNNGNTTTHNTTTFQSNYGGQGNGTNGPGTGSGSGSGGNGDGSGNGDGDGDSPGSPGQGVGSLYPGTDKTLSGLVADHYARISETPMLGAVRAFFQVNGGGSCPTWTIAATQWNPSMTLDQHCSGTFLATLQLCGWVLLGIVSYLAIRIAVT